MHCTHTKAAKMTKDRLSGRIAHNQRRVANEVFWKLDKSLRWRLVSALFILEIESIFGSGVYRVTSYAWSAPMLSAAFWRAVNAVFSPHLLSDSLPYRIVSILTIDVTFKSPLPGYIVVAIYLSVFLPRPCPYCLSWYSLYSYVNCRLTSLSQLGAIRRACVRAAVWIARCKKGSRTRWPHQYVSSFSLTNVWHVCGPLHTSEHVQGHCPLESRGHYQFKAHSFHIRKCVICSQRIAIQLNTFDPISRRATLSHFLISRTICLLPLFSIGERSTWRDSRWMVQHRNIRAVWIELNLNGTLDSTEQQ